MPLKNYYFDFYQCDTKSPSITVTPKQTLDIIESLFQNFDQNLNSSAKTIGNCNYELRSIEKTNYGFKGIIGKHRKNDLPHVASVGGVEREILLAPGENLLEKTQFAFYSDYGLLILQRNHYCISSSNLAKYLSEASYTTSMNPLIEPADLKKLINNRIQIRTAEITIARPRNPDLFREAEHDFNNAIIATLRGSGTAKLNLSLRGDARSNNPEDKYLKNKFKLGIQEMLNTFDVKKCKLLMEDQDTYLIHPVDLVADRLFYNKDLEVEGRYPNPYAIWNAIEEARAEKENELKSYFGDLTQPRLE